MVRVMPSTLPNTKEQAQFPRACGPGKLPQALTIDHKCSIFRP